MQFDTEPRLMETQMLFLGLAISFGNTYLIIIIIIIIIIKKPESFECKRRNKNSHMTTLSFANILDIWAFLWKK